MDNSALINEQMEQRLAAANEMDMVLRYIARFDANGKAKVSLFHQLTERDCAIKLQE